MTNRLPRSHTLPPRITRARELRREATVPERILWGSLRSRKLAGLRFRRQQTAGPFVVDFFCAEARLVVEIDGETHSGRGEADDRRTAELRRHGLRVMRFTNDDVLKSFDAVLVAIARAAGVDW